MDKKNDTNPIILVVEDVQETREGIEKLLLVDGYRVTLARDEQDGIESARRQRPDLILVSLAGIPREVILSARRVRERAAIAEDVPVVVFCIDDILPVIIGHGPAQWVKTNAATHGLPLSDARVKGLLS